MSRTSKRSPRDTTPPDRIIDWAKVTERVAAEPHWVEQAKHTARETPWYEELTGDAKDDFYDVPAAKYKYGNQPVNDWPGLPPEFGLPRLTHDVRQSTLRTEGFYFRKAYDERAAHGLSYRVGSPAEFYDIHEEQEAIDIHNNDWLDSIFVFPESNRPASGGLPGALTEEGWRLMDDLPSEPVVEEFDDLPIAGAVFWLMKKAKKARLQRLREKKLREKEQTA